MELEFNFDANHTKNQVQVKSNRYHNMNHFNGIIDINENENENENEKEGNTIQSSQNSHSLNDKWTLWAHLPHDTDWSIQSYKKIFTVSSVEEAIAITETLPEALVKNCMLFIMREGIQPVWEDPQNRNGGCFSYKINNKSVYEVWKSMSYVLMGETISEEIIFSSCVTGITISPKRNFCIIKIWMRDCKNQNPNIVSNDIKGITPYGCLFKKHTPEY